MSIIGSIQKQMPDLDVIALDRDYFPNPWTQAQWMTLNSDQHQLLTWKIDQKLVGFALFGMNSGEEIAHLYKLVIHPDLQGQGVAQAFWIKILEFLRGFNVSSVYLEVNVENKRAIGFYEKSGFKVLRIQKKFYSDGRDALIMVASLGL